MHGLHDDIGYLRRIIEGAQGRFSRDIGPLTAWVAVIVAAAVAELVAGPQASAITTQVIWGTAVVSGWGVIALQAVRRARQRTAKTPVDRMLAGTWLAAWFAMSLIGVFGNAYGALAGPPLVAVLENVLATAIWSSGAILRERLLYGAAVGWWLVAGATFVLPAPTHLWLLIAAMLGLLLAPALWLARRWRADAKTPS